MTKVLVLGGGFSGVGVVQALEKFVKKKNDFEVEIVSDNNYFMFQPMLPGVAAGTIEASHIVNPIRRLCKKARFRRASVDEIDIENKKVKIVEKDITREHWIKYDHLVFAMGLSTDMTRVPGMSEHSLPMRTLGDAIFLRNELINKLEMASIEDSPEERKKLLTFVFVGGGFSGVETMGEVGDMIKKAIKNYPRIDKDEVGLILVHSRDRILNELGEKVARFAEEKLVERGMKLILNTRVKEVSPDRVTLSNGDVISSKTVICTTGNAPHKVITTLDFVNERGRLDTDEYFRVVKRDEHNNIVERIDDFWAIGDCAFIPNVKEIKRDPDALCPPTAQFAVRMAPVLAKNIICTIKGKKLKVFSFKEMGQMAVIGHLCGVAEVLKIRFSGVLAFFMWRAIYWHKLPGIYCKFRVLFDWIIHAFFPVDITQLDVYRTEKVDRSHYQKGSFVFHQGDIADYFYVIEEGQVEVLKVNSENIEVSLAVLNPGDSFGEMGLMQKAPRSASVRCITPVGLLKVSRNDFKALTGSYSTLRNQLELRVEEIKKSNNEVDNKLKDNLNKKATIEKKDSVAFDDLKLVTVSEKGKKQEANKENLDSFDQQFKKQMRQNLDKDVYFEKELEKKLYKNPSDKDVLKQYANLKHRLGDLDSALALYFQYLSIEPKDTRIMMKISSIYFDRHQYKKCIEILEKVANLLPDNLSVCLNLARVFYLTKQFSTAVDLLKEGLKKDPEEIHLLTLLAQCYNKQFYPQKGEKTINKVLIFHPNDVPPILVMVESLLMQERYVDAEFYVSKSRILDNGKYRQSINKFDRIIQMKYSKNVLFEDE